MKVIHVDGYAAGKQQGFEGSEIYLIACCGMCTFAAVEPVSNASAKTFASAILKILLRYGLSHTVVLDKDSKFLGVCRESLDLLHINCHILSGGNHNPMLVERVNRYLNKGLKIMTNERDTSGLPLKPSSSSSMHGTPAQSQARISHEVSLLSDANSNFQSISRPAKLLRSFPRLAQSNLTLVSLPNDSALATRSHCS